MGSIRQFLQQFEDAALDLPTLVTPPRNLTWVVGNTVEQAFQPIVERLNQVDGLTVTMAALRSDYWGQTMTVTGLLTGQDILGALQGENLGDALLLPSLMLKHGTDEFLDDMTVASVTQALQTPVIQVSNGAADLIKACLHQALVLHHPLQMGST